MSGEHTDQPLLLVIFGITGDLAQRKLLPALYHLLEAQELPESYKIVGISRRNVAADEVYAKLDGFMGDEQLKAPVVADLLEHTEMIQMDLIDEAAYAQLLQTLQTYERDLGEHAVRLYYLSIPPQVFSPIIRLLGKTGHNRPMSGEGDVARLLVEKPFGYDVSSAKELIATVDEHFGEGQIYRIDHYVAKETVQNILTFRFQNALFESVWNGRHIDHITVVAREKIDIEGRVGFYEETGALRDLIQSHLLQLLAITTMPEPVRLESADIHEQKLKLLKAIEPIAPDKVAVQAVRGQYAGYQDEVGNPDSLTETYAQLSLRINTDAWRDVPIILETGKALQEKLTEITVCFRQPADRQTEHNRLVFRIQPEEGITLELQVKRPGIEKRTELAAMKFNYADTFTTRSLDAYERVLVDAIRGDQTLFATAEEVLTSWKIIENVLSVWQQNANGLTIYPKGSRNPEGSLNPHDT